MAPTTRSCARRDVGKPARAIHGRSTDRVPPTFTHHQVCRRQEDRQARAQCAGARPKISSAAGLFFACQCRETTLRGPAFAPPRASRPALADDEPRFNASIDVFGRSRGRVRAFIHVHATAHFFGARHACAQIFPTRESHSKHLSIINLILISRTPSSPSPNRPARPTPPRLTAP